MHSHQVTRTASAGALLLAAAVIALCLVPASASAAPDLRWPRSWLNAPYLQAAYSDVAADGAGMTYAVGWASVGGYEDLVLTKYSPQGLLLFTRIFAGAAGRHDRGRAVAVNRQGNIVAVTGQTWNASGGSSVLTIAYTLGGKKLWTRRVATGSFRSSGRDVAVTSKGQVIVIGQVGDSATDDDDILVVKYARSGKQLWKKRINGRGNGHDIAAAVEVRSGYVYVAGAVVRVAPWTDLLLVKYSSGGKVLWTRRWSDGAEAHSERAAAMAVRGKTIALAGGGQAVTGDLVGLAVTYTTSGTLRWARLDQPPPNGRSSFAAVAIDGQGNVAAGGERWAAGQSGGSFFVSRYLSDGTSHWSYVRGSPTYHNRSTGVAVTASGDIFATGPSGTLYGTQARTVKLSPAGAEVWSSLYGATDEYHVGSAVALGGGGVSVAGAGNVAGLVLRYGLDPVP